MRIAILTATKRKIGGVESFTHMLKKVFEESGHRVEILTPDENIPKKKPLLLKILGLPYLNARLYKDKISVFDLVIANGEFGWNIHHPNFIVVFHGCYHGFAKYLSSYLDFKSFLLLKKDAWIQKMGAKDKTVVTVSSFTKNLLEDQGIHVKHVIPNAVDTERFKLNDLPKKQRYLCVSNQYGKLGYFGKGFDILETLASRGVPIDCVSNSKTSGSINWIPSISQDEIHTIYPEYQALIFPSRYEANAIVPLEAMACGIPVIMSPVGYANEIRKEIPECVVDDWNPDTYMNRIREIDPIREQLSKKCRKFAEKHSLQHFKKNWLDLVENLNK